jgi:hypothetical protein
MVLYFCFINLKINLEDMLLSFATLQYYYRKLNFIIFYQECLYLILIHDFICFHLLFMLKKGSYFDQFNLMFINFNFLEFHLHQNIINLLININLSYLLLILIWPEIIVLVFIVINYMLIIFLVLLLNF